MYAPVGGGNARTALISALAGGSGMHRPNLTAPQGMGRPNLFQSSGVPNPGGSRLGGPLDEGDPNAPPQQMQGVSPLQMLSGMFNTSNMQRRSQLPLRGAQGQGNMQDILYRLLLAQFGPTEG